MPNNFEPSGTVIDEPERKPYYHDATAAGMITGTVSSTKLFIIEEADIVLNQMCAFPQSQHSNKLVVRPQTDARHLLIKLYDGDPHIRQLKNSSTSATICKHNVLGASTGQIIEQQMELKQAGCHVDALFERFILWPLNPKPIMMRSDVYTIDNKRNPSLEHFSIILALLSNFHLGFTDAACETMIRLGNELATTAYCERNDRALSARMGKTHQNILRVVGIVQLLECAYKIAQEYLQTEDEFPAKITDEFIANIRSLVADLYPTPHDDNIPRIYIDIDVTNHGINVMQSLLEQYKLLMFIPPEISIYRASTTNPPMTTSQIMQVQQVFNTKNLNQLHIRQILLFESVVFSPKTLISKISSIRHNCKNLHDNLHKLTTIGLLISFKDGTIAKTKKTQIYVKAFPDPNDILGQQNHEALIAQFNDNTLTAETIRSSTTKAYICTKSLLRPEVVEILQSPAYASFNFDLSNITQQIQMQNTSNIPHDHRYLFTDESAMSYNEPLSVGTPEPNFNNISLRHIITSVRSATDNPTDKSASPLSTSINTNMTNIENPDAVIALWQQIEETRQIQRDQQSEIAVNDVRFLHCSSNDQPSGSSDPMPMPSMNDQLSLLVQNNREKHNLTEGTNSQHSNTLIDNNNPNMTSNQRLMIHGIRATADHQQHAIINPPEIFTAIDELESSNVVMEDLEKEPKLPKTTRKTIPMIKKRLRQPAKHK